MPYILKLNLVYKCMYKLILKKTVGGGEYRMTKKKKFNSISIYQYIVLDIVVGVGGRQSRKRRRWIS